MLGFNGAWWRGARVCVVCVVLHGQHLKKQMLGFLPFRFELLLLPLDRLFQLGGIICNTLSNAVHSPEQKSEKEIL